MIVENIEDGNGFEDEDDSDAEVINRSYFYTTWGRRIKGNSPFTKEQTKAFKDELRKYHNSKVLDKKQRKEQKQLSKIENFETELKLSKMGSSKTKAFLVVAVGSSEIYNQVLKVGMKLKTPTVIGDCHYVELELNDIVIKDNVIYRITKLNVIDKVASVIPIYFCRYNYPESIMKELDY